ncbi:MAG: AraC family transcriptional regulator [Cyclobacteriaceae bacterium]|nr:AraC family transcriptional regulator [Cyclobacteriaceae bacterium]
MKVVPFNVPHISQEAFRSQVDLLKHFYDELHAHPEIQIMLIRQSEGTLIAGDYVGRFEAGDLFVIGGNLPHVFRNDEIYYNSGKRVKAHSISLYFNQNYLGEHFWQLDEMRPVRNFVEKAGRGLKIYGRTKEGVEKEILKISKLKGIEKIICFFEILKLLTCSKELKQLSVSHYREGYSESEGKRMNNILQFTFQESHRKIYIDEVAEIANLSSEAFCRYFKTRTGKTYTNFLNEVRVSNACKLLINKDLIVQDVCYQVGFINLSNFNRVFKRITGKTPSNYISSQ